jgi:hypothetical protein
MEDYPDASTAGGIDQILKIALSQRVEPIPSSRQPDWQMSVVLPPGCGFLLARVRIQATTRLVPVARGGRVLAARVRSWLQNGGVDRSRVRTLM